LKKNQFVIILGAFIVIVFLIAIAFRQTSGVDREETEFKVPASINEIWAP